MATLQIKRNELKYQMGFLEAISLQNELDVLLQRDKYSVNGDYLVRSLYFDSLNNIDFMEKAAGYERRKKVRIRVYSPEATDGKFEIKQKVGDYSHKKSLLVSASEMRQAMDGDYSFLLEKESGTALELYSLLTLGCYRPATIIEYQRTAFSYVENNVRITFDKNIKCSETDLDLLSNNLCYLPAIDDRVILEVKYNGTLLKAISDILRKYNLVQVSVSKYGVGRPIYTKYM